MSPADWKVVLAFWHVMERTLRCVYCKHMVSLFNFPVPCPPFAPFKHCCVCQRPGWRCDASFLARIWFVGQNVTVLTELDCLASCFMSPVNLKGFLVGFFLVFFLSCLYNWRAVKVLQHWTKRRSDVERDEPCSGAFKGFNLFPDEKNPTLVLKFRVNFEITSSAVFSHGIMEIHL